MVNSLLFGLFVALAAPQLVVQSKASDTELPRITVRLYNYAGAPQDILVCAQQLATRVLLATGVRLSWLQCTLDKQGFAQDLRCHEVRGPAAIWLRICPREMALKGRMPPGICGFSLMPERGSAMTAWVYFHRLEQLADKTKLRKGPLLGTMMAHEIGHLLLGVNSHSQEGIMSIPWDAKTLRKADRGELGFTAEEGAAIRAEVLRRLRDGRTLAGPPAVRSAPKAGEGVDQKYRRGAVAEHDHNRRP